MNKLKSFLQKKTGPKKEEQQAPPPRQEKKKPEKTFLQLSAKERRFIRLLRRFFYLRHEKNKEKSQNQSLTAERLKSYAKEFFSQEKYQNVDAKTKEQLTAIAIYDEFPAGIKAKGFLFENYGREYPPVESTAKIFSFFMSQLPIEQRLLFIDSCDILSPELSSKLQTTFLNADFILQIDDKQLQVALNHFDILNLAKLVSFNSDIKIKSKIMQNLSKRNLNRFLKDLQFIENFSEYERFVGAMQITGELINYNWAAQTQPPVSS